MGQSKKSLDDYKLILKKAISLKIDLIQNKDLGFGWLRKMVKEMEENKSYISVKSDGSKKSSGFSNRVEI